MALRQIRCGISEMGKIKYGPLRSDRRGLDPRSELLGSAQDPPSNQQQNQRQEVECPQCCEVFPLARSIERELAIEQMLGAVEPAVLDLRCPLGHRFRVDPANLWVCTRS
jgi:hypothetical protein